MSAKEVEQGKPEPFFWIDCIAINQHKVDGELDQLGNVLRDAKATVAICDPWDKPVAVSRSWCLYEFLATIQSKRSFIVALSREQQASFVAALVEHFDSVDRWISRVDARQATASMPEDKAKIDGAVSATIGFERLNETVQVALKRWLRDAGEEVLEQLIATHGPQHERVLRLQNSLGMMLRMQQSDRAAMLRAAHHCAAVLHARRALLGPRHPDTLASLSSLGMVHRALGDGVTAREELREAREGLVSALGAEHPAALRAGNDLAFTLKAQGELAAAEGLLAEALAALEVELQRLQTAAAAAAGGSETEAEVTLVPPPEAAATDGAAGGTGLRRRLDDLEDVRCSLLSNRGGVLALQGRHGEALETLELAWGIKQRLKGAKHPLSLMTGADVAMARHRRAVAAATPPPPRQEEGGTSSNGGGDGLGAAAAAAADAAAGLALQREMLAACTEVLGGEHRHTAMLLNNLAVMLVEQRWWRQREQQLPEQPSVSGAGEERPGSRTSSRSGNGDVLTPEELFDRALRAYLRSRGPGHPCTLAVLLNRGLAEATDRTSTAVEAATAPAAVPIAAAISRGSSSNSGGGGGGGSGRQRQEAPVPVPVPPALRRLADHVRQHEEAREALQAALPDVLRVLLEEPPVPSVAVVSGGGDGGGGAGPDPVRMLEAWLLVSMAANLELLRVPEAVAAV